MATPQIIVRIAFVNNAFDASPTWVDVSSECVKFSIRRGRNYEMGRMEAGTATVTLLNLAGNYWPYNSGGSHYGYVTPVKRINIRAVYGGVTYDLFTGFIEKWKPTWIISGTIIGAAMVLTCSDLQKNISRFTLNTSYSAELSGTRVGHILTSMNWPVGARTIATGQSTIQASTLVNVNALSHLYSVLDAELGIFFVGIDGKAVFQDRLTRNSAPYNTPQATFTDVGGKDYIVPAVTFDDTYIYNEIRRTRLGGTEIYGKNAVSVTQFGQRTLPASGLLNSTDDDVMASVFYLLARYKNPLLRVESLSVIPGIDPDTLYPYVLGFDLSTCINIVLTQASINENYSIEGINLDWSSNKPNELSCQWQLSNYSKVTFPTKTTTTLHPNGAGVYTQLTPDSGANWQCVLTVDGVNVVNSASGQQDWYALDDMVSVGEVANITVKSYGYGTGGTFNNVLYVGGVAYYSADHTITGGSLYYTDTWQLSGLTLADINAMQAGVRINTGYGYIDYLEVQVEHYS